MSPQAQTRRELLSKGLNERVVKTKMINRLPRAYRAKYKKKRGWDEELIMFAFKVVGSTALVFIVAAGVDVYHLIQ